MSAQTLLDGLQRRGASFRANGDWLRWRAPVGVMTDADLSAIREHKPKLMAILKERGAEIIQFDAYLSRREAERRARNEQHNGGNAA
jgi:hypothetical protein